MIYSNIVKGIFLERPNRFIAIVKVEGKEERVHVKNTGRCRELLTPNAEVYIEDFIDNMRKRKLRYSLIAVKKGNMLINMDSQVPNKVVKEALENKTITLPEMGELEVIRPEKTYMNSRLDFYLEDNLGNKGFIEVKGVTLEEDGIVRFPDAPTERGLKHLEHLIEARKNGYKAYVVFLAQMEKAKFFTPNVNTDKKFADTLTKAKEEGVHVLSYLCNITEDEISLKEKLAVKLQC